MKVSHTSKWAGIGHKRKMELKAEERRKRTRSFYPYGMARSQADHLDRQFKLQRHWNSTSKAEPEFSAAQQESV